jgi:hypothetical protein
VRKHLANAWFNWAYFSNTPEAVQQAQTRLKTLYQWHGQEAEILERLQDLNDLLALG